MRYLILSGLLALPAAAGAATFNVTKGSDTFDGACNSDCSLREAIEAANHSPGPDTIVLKAAVYRITRATYRPPEQDDNVTIDEEQNADGDFDVLDDLLVKGVSGGSAIDGGKLDRLLDVAPGVNFEIRDVDLRNGWTRERGGAVSNAGSTKLTRVKMHANLASSSFNLGQGAAVFNAGYLSIADSQVYDNVAGGGEASSGEGGGVYNTGQFNARSTRFSGNQTRDDNDIGGGGAVMNRGGTVKVERCFFYRNSTLMHGYGGALANRDGGRMVILNSTISGNESGEPPYGGAVANGTALKWDSGDVTMRFVTLADNDGGGLYNAGAAIYIDTIIAGNYEDYGGDSRDYFAGNNCVNLYYTRSAGSVLGNDIDESCGTEQYVGNSEVLTALLYPLAHNGGFAPTHALRASSSILIDQATGNEGGCPATDQRGAPRPADGNGDGVAACDIGAFERGAND